MPTQAPPPLARRAAGVVLALGERPIFAEGDRVVVATRAPIGHYRVPTYLRGKTGVVETVIMPPAVDNEEEGFGRDVGMKRHYYRVAFAMRHIWPDYEGGSLDNLRVEVFESWLARLS